ncbi:hypothetical protein QC762_0084340 [Podospora pseudocomata]|uniref:Uncharacterized protein n=1 Tax=Podospora pseudocomata TaxID=2093779 RepID=A0ABR0GCM8_9PEZI|nr:hypothetical protein QC762_0084340 [Podospora pseudocomata]
MLLTVVYTSFVDLAQEAKALGFVLSEFLSDHTTFGRHPQQSGSYLLFLFAVLHLTQNEKEPPLVATAVPFLSPVIGMVKLSMDFYTNMRNKHHDLPIYNLRLPGTRLYIVNSLNLILSVQRQWRTLILPPVSARASEVAMGVSKDALAIIREDMIADTGFFHTFIKATYPSLSSGPALERLSGDAMTVLTASLDNIVD